MNALNIRSWADARAFLSVAIPGIAAVLVAAGAFQKDVADLWVGLALVMVHAGVSSFNSSNGFRVLFYPLLVAVGGLLIRYGYTTDAKWALWTSIVPILIGPGVAAANTDTTESVAS